MGTLALSPATRLTALLLALTLFITPVLQHQSAWWDTGQRVLAETTASGFASLYHLAHFSSALAKAFPTWLCPLPALYIDLHVAAHLQPA
jgi:hypothetical protein